MPQSQKWARLKYFYMGGRKYWSHHLPGCTLSASGQRSPGTVAHPLCETQYVLCPVCTYSYFEKHFYYSPDDAS